VDIYDLICAVEVVIVLALAGALWPRARRVKGPWLREWLTCSIVGVAILAPLFAVIARDPVWSVGGALILGPLFALGPVFPEMQIQHAAEQRRAEIAAMKARRDQMRALFRGGDGTDA
jgi:hypothetical protein